MPGSCECLICAPLGPDRESNGIVVSLILMIHMQLQHLSYQLPFSSQTWPFGCHIPLCHKAIMIHTTKALSWPLLNAQKSLHRLSHALLPS